MTDEPDPSCLREKLERLPVKFHVPDAGWVKLEIPGLAAGVDCTYISDPFPDMMAWLEQIASGAANAVWSIAEEGSSSHFVFLSGGWLGGGEEMLAYFRTSEGGTWETADVRVPRRSLVETFYTGFRAMTAEPDYSAREWEWSFDWRQCEQGLYLDEASDEDYDRLHAVFPYDGSNLRTLRSPMIEAWISGDWPDFGQLALPLGD